MSNIQNQQINNQNQQLKNLRGNNNGTWGFGMYGAFFPSSMNGPLGSINLPLPYDNPLSNASSPSYNSKYGNFPKYNEKQFIELRGYNLGSNFGAYCGSL